MSEKVLTDFEIVQILNTDRPKTGWAYGLCREVEAKVASRCRAQGGNASDNITQAAANKAAEEATLKHLRSAVESMPQRTVQGCKYVHLDSVLAEICQLEIIAADRAARPVANKAAEEGGLLHEIKEFLGDMHAMPVEWTIAQSQVLCAKVSDAIKADRASRQVANKAEVEPECAECNGTGGRQVGHGLLGPEWRECNACDGMGLLAAPPATTGASTTEGYTVPVSTMLREIRGIAGSTRRGVGARVSDILDLVKTYESKLSVGASTVPSVDTQEFRDIVMSFVRAGNENSGSTEADCVKKWEEIVSHINGHFSQTVGAFTSPSIAGQDFEFLLGAYMLAMESGATRRHCADCKKALVDYIDRFVSSNGKSVGASTVLTDERIEALREYANPKNWALDSEGIARIWLEPGSSTPDCYAGFELATKAIEDAPVAAQAGQVAVPEVLSKVTTICSELRDFYAGSNRHELSAVVCALMDRIGYEFSSPAKESK